MTPPDDGRPVSERVVAAVGRERDADPTDLDPLYDAVDPESLNGLIEAAQRNGRSAVEITFEYYGHTVTVASNGTVTLTG